ncbi:MAG: hypothetical protein ACREE2_16465, partial [Stellaceae bacterium]
HRPVERRSHRQAARRDRLTLPANPAGERDAMPLLHHAMGHDPFTLAALPQQKKKRGGIGGQEHGFAPSKLQPFPIASAGDGSVARLAGLCRRTDHNGISDSELIEKYTC